MTLNVKLRGSTHAQVAYLAKIKRKLQNRREGLVQATNKVAEVFDRNFTSEGSMVGGWAELAEKTKEIRREQGYGPTPILIRYGALRAVVTQGFMQANGPGSWARTDDYSDHTTSARLRISRDTAVLEAHGWKVANQWGHPNRSGRPVPARAFWFTTRPAMSAAKEGVVRWIATEVLP